MPEAGCPVHDPDPLFDTEEEARIATEERVARYRACRQRGWDKHCPDIPFITEKEWHAQDDPGNDDLLPTNFCDNKTVTWEDQEPRKPGDEPYTSAPSGWQPPPIDEEEADKVYDDAPPVGPVKSDDPPFGGLEFGDGDE